MSDLIITNPIENELRKFDEAKDSIAALAEKCNKIIVNSPESLEMAKDLAKNAKKIENAIENKRKELTAPYLDMQRNIKAKADALVKDLNDSIKNLRNQILEFEKEQERKRQEELRKIQEEKRKAEEEMREKIKADNQADFSQPLPTFVNPEIQAREKELETSKTNSLRKSWEYEVLNEKDIPREYLTIDSAKIKAAIKDGTREIPGIRIFEKETLYLR